MTSMNATIDLTDVPPVSARELSVAVKLLTLHGASLETAHAMPDEALRAVFTAYWSLVGRDGGRKTATLVRLQNLINVCSTRRITGLLESYGRAGIAEAVSAAASSRLNTTYGFNPLKIGRAVHVALACQGGVIARAPLAA